MQESSQAARVSVGYDAGFNGAEGELAMPGTLAATRDRFFSLTIVLLVALFASAQDPGWPRQITKASGKLVYYQPQVDDWKNYKAIDARMAFTITPTGGKEHVGVVTVADAVQRQHGHAHRVLSNPQITSLTSLRSILRLRRRWINW